MSVVSSSSKRGPIVWRDGAIPYCPRCGGRHHDLDVRHFESPIVVEGRTFESWAPCPATGEPILLQNPPRHASRPALWDCMARAMELYISEVMKDADEGIMRAMIVPDVVMVQGYW